MKKVCLCVIPLLLLMITICYCMWVQKYNNCVKELNERYSYLYEDFLCVIENENVPFEEINSEFAFFLTSYAEWETLYRENYKINIMPRTHEELGITPEDVVEAYRNLRDLYYKTVQEAYFDEKTMTEKTKVELNIINNKFNILFEELSYF